MMKVRSHVRAAALALGAWSALGAVSAVAESPPTAHSALIGPRWLDDGGRAAGALLELLDSAKLDGLDPAAYKSAELRRLVDKASHGSPANRAAVEARLSDTFGHYAADVARPREGTTLYVDPAAKPRPVSVERLIAVAAASPRFDEFVRSQGWMHPYYNALREALGRELTDGGDPARAAHIRINLERARVLPRGPGAAVIVNAAAARLEFFEDRTVRDSMRVVVGKTAQQTPMMAGIIRYAILNPYWHVPPDLTRERIAPRVLKEGLPYLRRQGYQVVTDWSDKGREIPPSDVDWKAVASGKTEVFLRQLPGPANSMGKIKFMLPNDLGIYLHDSPVRELFQKNDRQFSGGCVRLEDADGLRDLLLGNSPRPVSRQPEQVIALQKPVPVYLTYLTMFPQNGTIVERRDVYGRDKIAIGDVKRSRPSAG